MCDSESCSVSGALATVLRVSRVLGLAPLRLVPTSKSVLPRRTSSIRPLEQLSPGPIGFTISISRRLAIFGRVVVFTIILFHLLSCIQFVYLDSQILKVFIATSMLVSLSTLAIPAFDGINKMKRYISYFNKIDEIHKILDSNYLNVKLKYFSVIFWGFLSNIFLRCSWRLYFIIKTALKNEFGIDTLLQYGFELVLDIKQIMQLLVMMQFAFLVCSVNATLRVLNERLHSLIYKLKLYGWTLYIERGSMETGTVTNANATLGRLCRAYMSICDLVRSIDSGEGTLLFFLLFAWILDIMSSLYIIISMVEYLDEMPYDLMIRFGMIVILNLYKEASLVLLVEPCHKTRQEFQEIQNTVSELMCASYQREFRDELSRYHDQFVHNIPAFTPLGICVLSRQFLFMIISSTLTFVTIVLQFHLKVQVDV